MERLFRVFENLRNMENIRKRSTSTGLKSVLIDPQGLNLIGKSRLWDSEPSGGSSGTGHAPFAFHQGTLNHFLLLVAQGFSERLG